MKDLGLGVDLSPSVQQQPHHDHVAASGGDVQGSDAVLQRGRSQTHVSAVEWGKGGGQNSLPDGWQHPTFGVKLTLAPLLSSS